MTEHSLMNLAGGAPLQTVPADTYVLGFDDIDQTRVAGTDGCIEILVAT